MEGSVGYKEDHYSVSQVLHDRYNKKTEEKSNLIPNEKDQILWPFSGSSPRLCFIFTVFLVNSMTMELEGSLGRKCSEQLFDFEMLFFP